MGHGHNFGWRKRPIVDECMQCQLCENWIPIGEYYVQPGSGRRDTRCNRCRKAAMCARNLCMTVEKYLAMMNRMECEICGLQSRNLHVDHDHATGKLRGVLCSLCNIGLGHFKDNYDSLVQAAHYVSKYEDLHRHLTVTDEDRTRNERMADASRKRERR